jgi:hypothetical protein
MKGKFGIQRDCRRALVRGARGNIRRVLTRLHQGEYSMLNLAEVAAKEVGRSIFSFTLNTK